MSKLRDAMFLNVKSLNKKQVEIKGMIVVSFTAIGNDTMATGAAVEQAIRGKLMTMLLDQVSVSPELVKEISKQKKGAQDGTGKN